PLEEEWNRQGKSEESLLEAVLGVSALGIPFSLPILQMLSKGQGARLFLLGRALTELPTGFCILAIARRKFFLERSLFEKTQWILVHRHFEEALEPAFW